MDIGENCDKTVLKRRKYDRQVLHPFEELVARLESLQKKNQFCCFNRINNTIKFVIKPNDKVIVFVDIWDTKALFICIKFVVCREIVKFTDATFTKLTTTLKVRRLQNFRANIKRIGTSKEELFPDVNWSDFIDCKNFDCQIYLPLILFPKQSMKNSEQKFGVVLV